MRRKMQYVVSCLFYPSVEFYATVATTQIGGLQAKGKTSQTFKTSSSKPFRQNITGNWWRDWHCVGASEGFYL